jgi:uncharacterized membrane protein YqhA
MDKEEHTTAECPDEQQGRCGKNESMNVMVNTIASSSRWLFTLAVLGSALISVYLFVLGFVTTILIIVGSFTHMGFHAEYMKEIIAVFMEIIDTFLVATVFYLMSLGLYELFIAKAPLPGWVKICDLDDLKTKLLGLIIIALAVLFMGKALTWAPGDDLLEFGLAIGVMIIAISGYVWIKH